MKKEFAPKLFTLLRAGISKKQLSQDILAGVIVGVVALPLAIAFAIASGVSPEKGLITAVVAGFIISAFGGSRVQIGGPAGAWGWRPDHSHIYGGLYHHGNGFCQTGQLPEIYPLSLNRWLYQRDCIDYFLLPNEGFLRAAHR